MKTMEFYEAVRKGIIKTGDYVDAEELFFKEKPEITISGNLTGCGRNQTFKRERLEWIFSKDEKGNLKLFGSTTEDRLTLYGKAGYENGVKVQNTILKKLYSNNNIDIEASATTKEDYEFLFKHQAIRDKHRLKLVHCWNAATWLGSSLIVENARQTGYTHYCIYCVLSDSAIQISSLFNSNYQEGTKCLGLRPVLLIPEYQILVDVDSKKKEGCWKLVTKNNKCYR